MMNSTYNQWETLAELYFNISGVKEEESYIYCLCSRVFCRNSFDILPYSLEYDEDVTTVNKNEKIPITHVHFSQGANDKTYENDPENVSCYCSASHTDNYYSTDEHETPIVSAITPRFSKEIQSSDSGADLSEYGFQDSSLVSDKHKVQHQSDISSTTDCAEVKSKNYLDCSTWERYWSINGERLIWASWIEKYSEYINPEFSEKDSEKYNSSITKNKSSYSKNTDFKNSSTSFVGSYPTNCIITVEDNSNPVSQTYNDELWNTTRYSDQDHLLSPRCPSSNSIPNTIGTTDSMTNVTQMTVSSYELNSSTVSSESSKDSSEAAVSLDSHESGPWSDNAGNMSAPDYDDTMDADQYWQILWKKHFEELYAKHYALYLAEHMLENPNDKRKLNVNQNKVLDTKREKSRPNKRKNDRYVTSVGALLKNLSAAKINDSEMESCDTACDFQTCVSPDNSEKITKNVLHLEDTLRVDNGSEQLSDIIDSCNDGPAETDESEMQCKNQSNEVSIENVQSDSITPSQLNSSHMLNITNRKGGEDDPPEDNRSISLKRSHESDTEEPNLEKAKAAFSLMGFAFADNNADEEQASLATGEVVYRKRNIRLQNRYLKMKHNKSNFNSTDLKPTHTYFDDQGKTCGKVSNNSRYENKLESSSEEESAVNTNMKQSPQIIVNNDEGSSGINKSIAISEETLVEETGLDVMEARTTGKTLLITSDDDNQSFQEDTLVNRTDVNKIKREKRKRKKLKKNLNIPAELENDQQLIKYWYKRYSLFSKFDQGIHLDAESWYSVTPEKVAKHTAVRCRSDLIIDAFCGAGGNAIQFAMTCERVIAIDVDPEKISIAKHNATVYGVADRIEFIVGDFLQLSESLVADVVFLSPPWGGPQYLQEECYDLEKSLCPVSGSELMKATRKITQNIAIFLPRNTNTNQLVLMAGLGGSVEIEQNFLDKKLIAITAFYGGLLNE